MSRDYLTERISALITAAGLGMMGGGFVLARRGLNDIGGLASLLTMDHAFGSGLYVLAFGALLSVFGFLFTAHVLITSPDLFVTVILHLTAGIAAIFISLGHRVGHFVFQLYIAAVTRAQNEVRSVSNSSRQALRSQSFA